MLQTCVSISGPEVLCVKAKDLCSLALVSHPNPVADRVVGEKGYQAPVWTPGTGFGQPMTDVLFFFFSGRAHWLAALP